ncbi:MAG: hypothetical protein KGJ23_05035 [Euryarchaeota archaeon]|nr:hypothetical protein [Euryarchaeota archaeon]MDE1835963.1 hypothetical protein [Euryarchaeota archaeon]MDE1881106.1 hypothetical protein [Euryarchaeota archaeon]MDE2044359.1 hypothetical protein [Thermoplasmata archaeon]
MTTKAIVDTYAEKLDRALLDSRTLQKFLSRRPGIYALYSGKSLYYVGMATNLWTRLNQHGKDRHRSSWNRFSVYSSPPLINVRGLEALLHHVSPDVPGIRQRGKLVRALDLNHLLDQASHRADARALLRRDVSARGRELPARLRKRILRSGGILVGQTRKRRIGALLLQDGRVLLNGTYFSSMTEAAQWVCPYKVNGRDFWKYEHRPGVWRPVYGRRSRASR